MERLITAIQQKANPSVVGLDPTPALLPEPLLRPVRDQVLADQPAALAESYWLFNRAIIDAVRDVVPAVKPQIAMYEALGLAGLQAYLRTTEYAQAQGLYVLGDVKRGDIGSTAAAYAAHLSGFAGLDGQGQTDLWYEDAVTVNPYLGVDGIKPFIEAALAADKDIFVLVRTSNPSSSQLQTLPVQVDDPAENHENHADSAKPSEATSRLTVSDAVADLVEEWGSSSRPVVNSATGQPARPLYSRVGAVIGATHPQEGRRLRERMPHTFFLVPGFGAQGGGPADVVPMFDQAGGGAIVNSSRGIIGAWKQDEATMAALAATTASVDQALDCVARQARQAAILMRDSITHELEKSLEGTV